MEARGNALDDVGLSRQQYCCRRMLLSHVDVIDQLLLYSNNPGEKTAPKYVEELPEDYTEPDPEAADDDDTDAEEEYTEEEDYTLVPEEEEEEEEEEVQYSSEDEE